jgi:macrodomain Ter protein organizer (MatP/YcbG family)
VKRTQLTLDDEVWQYLHALAREKDTTISDIVSAALREKQAQDQARRKAAFEAVVGLWEDRTDLGDTEEYVRKLRRSTRRERIGF